MKTFITGLLAAVVGAVIVVYLAPARVVQVPIGAQSGPLHTGPEEFLDEVTLSNCGTKTFNPGSIATSTLAAATSTDIALAGAALGDVCFGSLTSATTTDAQITCVVTQTATATLSLVNLGAAAVDYATGTAKVCYFD